MDDNKRRRKLLDDIFSGKVFKSNQSSADLGKEGVLSDPMREEDFLDGLPIPFGDDLLVNPFVEISHGR